MADDRMTRLIEAGNEIQVLVARLQERVTQAARDGYDIEEADLFVVMRDILGEPAITNRRHNTRTRNYVDYLKQGGRCEISTSGRRGGGQLKTRRSPL
jgi:hypothetical protein